MGNMEIPITLDEQVIMMKKYVSFRQRKKMRKFLEYAGYFRASRYGKYLLSHVGNIGSKSKQDVLFLLYQFDVKIRRVLVYFLKHGKICMIGSMHFSVVFEYNSRGRREAWVVP